MIIGELLNLAALISSQVLTKASAFHQFLGIYGLFLENGTERERERGREGGRKRENLLSADQFPKWRQHLEFDQTVARNLKLHLSLSCLCQMPNNFSHLSLLFQVHHQGAKWKEDAMGSEPVLKRYAAIVGCGLAWNASMLAPICSAFQKNKFYLIII